MKILTAAQIRACDEYTISSTGITSDMLMERAAAKCVSWLRDNLPRESLFVVLCGMGNNGGDGLVIARMLQRNGYGVKAFLLKTGQRMSADCSLNLQRMQAAGKELITEVPEGTFITDIPEHIVVIDAILGTGVSRAIKGWLSEFVTRINQLPNRKIAIDMPTGLMADAAPGTNDVILKADDTLSFQFRKRSFLHPEGGPYTGEVHLLDIGLDREWINNAHTNYYITQLQDIEGIYRPRQPFSHKGSYGSALLCGGSHGKMGAMVLAARAAVKTGAGLTTVLIPECGYDVLQTAVPEAMCLTSGVNDITHLTADSRATAIGIGPGMGTHAATADALEAFLTQCTVPLVLDADALNIIAERGLQTQIPAGSIITPHPKEYARLFGDHGDSMNRVDNARIQAMHYNIIIVLKDRHTAVINTDGTCWYNTTGNAGMAKGGSGDVLTGIIIALLAQGYTPWQAAQMGVYLHGLAGDKAAAVNGMEAMCASDIIAHLGAAFRSLARDKLHN